jgi:DNA-binding MarR family transcriptional regulator
MIVRAMIIAVAIINQEGKALTENEHYLNFLNLFRLNAGIYVRARRWIERRLKPLNMTFPQFGALMALSPRDGIAQRELAEMLETDTTTVMVICDSLAKKGWLTREPDAADRRVNRLVLTDSGRAVFAQAMPQIQAGIEPVMKGIPADDLERAAPVLEELYRNVTELLQQEAGPRRQRAKGRQGG